MGGRTVSAAAGPVKSPAAASTVLVLVFVRGRAVPRHQCVGTKDPLSFHGTEGLDGVIMILPQVHLRKPCYDFTFL